MSDCLEHRGYFGSVQYSADDELLYGKLLGIRDLVSFDGTNLKVLQKNFRDAVDEYLAFCTAEGRSPNVPFKGTFNVRITPELHSRAVTLAQRHKKKLNAIVTEALEAYVAKAG